MANDDIEIDDSGIFAVLEDRAASYWLKAALDGALNRDPVDAANDAEVMAKILTQRVIQPANSHQPKPLQQK